MAAIPSISVSGAGESSLNGTYEPIGQYSGKTQWQKPNTRLYIRWRGPEKKEQYKVYHGSVSGTDVNDKYRWELYCPSGATYYYHNQDTTTPETNDWQSTDFAEPPAPVLTIIPK